MIIFFQKHYKILWPQILDDSVSWLERVCCHTVDICEMFIYFRNAPSWLGAEMCNAAVTELLKDDLSPHYCPKDPEQQPEDEQDVVCEWFTWFGSCSCISCYIYIYISAVKRLIVINHIQNKSFCLHNVYISYVYINTNTCMYIFKKNMLCLCSIYLYII